MTTPQNMPDIPEDYRAEINEVYHAWHANEISFADALKQFEAMLKAAQDEKSDIKQAAVYNILGVVYGYRSSYDDSVDYFQKARNLFEQAGATRRVITCDLNLGETYRLRGNFTRARSYFHHAYEQGKAIGSIRTQTTALSNEGQMWLSMGSTERARDCLERALRLSYTEWTEIDKVANEDVQRADERCETLHALADVALTEGNLDEAWQHAVESFNLAEQIQRPLRLGFANRALGTVITAFGGNPPDAIFSESPDAYYTKAIKYFKQVKAEGEVGKTYFAQGKSMAKRNKKRSAVNKFQQAMIIFTKLGMTNDAASAAEEQLKVI